MEARKLKAQKLNVGKWPVNMGAKVLSSLPAMARRKEIRDATSSSKPLRILASGTLFLTHTLAVPCHSLTV